MKRILTRAAVVAAAILALLPGSANAATTELISVGLGGTPAAGTSFRPAITPDARFVAFDSFANNLAVGDGNSFRDVFVRDRALGATELVSVNSDELPANSNSDRPAISADGRFVAYTSTASNLVLGDTSNCATFPPPAPCRDIFVRDRVAGTTERVSVNSNEVQGNWHSDNPAISADGRFVAFNSQASNLGKPGDGSFTPDVFVRDRVLSKTEWVPPTPFLAFAYDPAISANGRFVAFASGNPDSGQCGAAFVRDRSLATTVVLSVNYAGDLREGCKVSMSADGRFATFESPSADLVEGDTNGATDVFVRDRDTDMDGVLDEAGAATTEKASVGAEAQANGPSSGPAISPDGRFVAFQSEATNLVPRDTNGILDVFVRDRVAGHTVRVSLTSDGNQAAGPGEQFGATGSTAITDDATVAFDSEATNLVLGDANAMTDIFLRSEQPDNCPDVLNPDQADADSDGIGDACDAGDADLDGFSDRVESRAGTDPLDACADDTSDDAWPADINNDTFSDTADIANVTAWFGEAVPPAPARVNIGPDPPDGFVDTADIARMTGLFGQGCA